MMVNVIVFETPPPGDGLLTLTPAVPDVAISAAVIAAVNCPLLTKVVVRGDPFHCTLEVDMKLDPLTVRLKLAPPAAVLVGDNE